MPRLTLLFTGGGGAGTQALYDLLCDKYDAHFADADPEAKAWSIPSRCWHTVPLAGDSRFIDDLRRLCGDLGVDVLVPGVDEELLPLSSARHTMPCELLLPPLSFVQTHLDKLSTAELLQSHGLSTPATESLSHRRRVTFPCILKPRCGRGSRNVAVVRSEAELRAHVATSRRPEGDFIVQELLLGQEYTVMMAADRSGILRAVVPVRVDLKRGITLRAETDRDEAVVEGCRAIHEADPVPGCYNIQLFKSPDGTVKPCEINPRISTTACLAVAAGVDFVDLCVGGHPASIDDRDGLARFQTGLRLKRAWHNEFLA